MRDLNDIYLFVQVVRHGGFAAAGRALDLPKSTLSRRVQQLENRLGVRLLQRTSRRFTVTAVGEDFLRHASAMLIEADAAENSVLRSLAEPIGTIRFTCPVGMAPLLARVVPSFLAAHPKVCLVQHATNRYVDLIAEGFDLALRGHGAPLPDSSLVRRRLRTTCWVLAASPAYLERAGTPRVPGDLQAHPALMIGEGDIDRSWTLRRETTDEQTVAVRARMLSDDIETLKQAAVAALGIVAVPDYLCNTELEGGTLRRVLPEWNAGEAEISMLAPTRRGQLPSLRAFMDFLVAELPPPASSSPTSPL